MSLTTNATRASSSSERRPSTFYVSRCRETGITSATRSPTTSASSTPGIFGFSDSRCIDIPAALWPEIVAAAGFEAMKAQGEALLPHQSRSFDDGAARFFHKGTNGRWQGTVLSTDLARYDAEVEMLFTVDLASWVSN